MKVFPSPTRRLLSRTLLTLLASGTLCATAGAGDAFKWSVQYLIDNSRVVFGRTQKVSPRHNRGLAISPDGRFLYAGYIHSFNNLGEVRRIAIDVPDYDTATVAILPGPMGKAITTDDKGRVYISDGTQILIYDAQLRERLFQLAGGTCDGLSAIREGAELVLYATDRDAGTINRLIIQENGNGVSNAELKGFDGTGIFKVPEAWELRGIKADGKGFLWVADHKGSKVFKVSIDGKTVTSAKVDMPMDLAYDRGRIFVTRDLERSITVLDESLHLLGNLSVPWEELEISPVGNNHHGGLAGIVALAGKGIFVANEGGQTANQRSTYGRTDDHSDIVNGKQYKDVFGDDNEPILRATEVTTAPEAVGTVVVPAAPAPQPALDPNAALPGTPPAPQ